jgi:hypothetical protein
MGEEKKGGKVDGLFNGIKKYVSERIGAFVAFLFFLVALGAFMAMVVMKKWPEYTYLTVIIPIIAGIISYRNRAIALGLFLLIALFVFIL